jgi:adenylate cyclase
LTSYFIGEFTLAPDERKLTRGGKELTLGARAFDLLCFLVANRHRVLTKAEMLDAVWPDIAVEESNLTVQISALRKALGPKALVTIPGRGYQFVLAVDEGIPGPAATPAPTAALHPRILVLPFANTSNDPDQEYFSDGIAEDVINDLSKVSALSVVARSTAFSFKGRAINLGEVAGDMNATHVVEGSVRKSGNRIRINTQLVDGATGHPIWADRFDRDLTDIFALQDEITQAIVDELRLRLAPSEREAIHARPTDNPEAYEIYLQARYHVMRTDRRNYLIAADLARQALDIDPNYDRAWALLAVSQVGLFNLFSSTDNGLAAAERALALNPNLAEALAAKASVLARLRQNDEALALCERALGIDPDAYDVRFHFGGICFNLGRHAEAITHWERAAEISPDAIAPITNVEMCYTAVGQTDKAMDTVHRATTRIERALSRDATDTFSLMCKVLNLAHLGKKDEAKQWAQRVKALGPEDPSIDYNIGCALALLGETEAALDMLETGFSRVDPVFSPPG